MTRTSLLRALLFLSGIVPVVLGSPLRARAVPAYCDAGRIRNIAYVLSVNGAQDFCSEYLSIPTVTIPETSSIPTTLTETVTVDAFATTTLTLATQVISFSERTTVATVPVTVATTVRTDRTTVTSTTTPARVTVTTTVWYTPGAVRRDAIHARSVTVPGFARPFASSAISSGCSCLDIPTPSTTITETTYIPTTISTPITQTLTQTNYATLTVSTTITIPATSSNPVTRTDVTTSTIVNTVEAATPTFVSTVSSAIRPQCTKILSGGKLFTAIQPQRSYSYPFATTFISSIQNPSAPQKENIFSQCCELCHNSPNCGQFYTYLAGPSQGWRCQIIPTWTQVNTGISAICPLGRLTNEGVSGRVYDWIAGNQARGIGPCYGYTVPV